MCVVISRVRISIATWLQPYKGTYFLLTTANEPKKTLESQYSVHEGF